MNTGGETPDRVNNAGGNVPRHVPTMLQLQYTFTFFVVEYPGQGLGSFTGSLPLKGISPKSAFTAASWMIGEYM